MRLRVLLMLAALAAAGYWWLEHRGQVGGPDAPSVERFEPPARADAGDLVPPRTGAGAPLPGDRLELSLITTGAAEVMPELQPTEADRTYEKLVREANGSARYDMHLSRAAGEFAAQAAVHGKPPPSAAITFLLQAAGAPDYNAAQYYLSTTNEGNSALEKAVRSALREAPRGEGDLLVGVGEAATPGDRYARRVCVLVTRRPYSIDRVSRRAKLGAKWTLRGTLPPGFKKPQLHALYPDGSIGTAKVAVSGRSFSVSVPTKKTAGTLHVGIDGVGRDGPGKLLQLSVEVGGEPPRIFTAVLPGPDPSFSSVEAAEAHALALLNRDRQRHGLPALESDPELAAIARGHSVDMRDNGFFGHQSPRTGLAGNRLEAAGYRSVAHAENLAQNDTLAAAQASLMASVGHRVNILHPRFTVAGVGLAKRTRNGQIEWFVTQLFAKKVTVIEPEAVASDLLARINQVRAARGRQALRIDASLGAAASRGAARAAAGSLDGLAQAVLDDAGPHMHRGGSVSAQALYDVDDLEPPEMALEARWVRVGIGVAQSERDTHGRTGVIILVAR